MANTNTPSASAGASGSSGSKQAAATNQLASLPFESLIGGPLDAAIKAQSLAAMSSIQFIKEVGFDKNNETRAVTFKYQKDKTTMELSVPLLTIVPIPFIRIDDMRINFKANISASDEASQQESQSRQAALSTEVGGRYYFVKASLNASASSKKDSSSTRDSKYSVEYTMDIDVHAKQDDMPAGMAKVLNMLNESIQAKEA